jgi:hypothetical protein
MMAVQSDTGRCTMPESRLSVGNVEILSITDIDVDFPIPLTQVFPDVPLEAWAPYKQRYPEMFLLARITVESISEGSCFALRGAPFW